MIVLKPNIRIHQPSGGFTIVELLIATVVSSVIMLLFATGIIQITRIYYKGVTGNETQNVARNIMDDITQAVQFSGDTITQAQGTTWDSLCLGSQRFTYQLGQQLTPGATDTVLHQAPAVLIQDTGSCSSAPTSAPAGQELLSANMRLTNLKVTQIGSSNLYTIIVNVAYGNDDLLCNPTKAGPSSCSTSAPMTDTGDYTGQLQCKDNTGDQFCWVSNLTTIVGQRDAAPTGVE